MNLTEVKFEIECLLEEFVDMTIGEIPDSTSLLISELKRLAERISIESNN